MIHSTQHCSRWFNSKTQQYARMYCRTIFYSRALSWSSNHITFSSNRSKFNLFLWVSCHNWIEIIESTKHNEKIRKNKIKRKQSLLNWFAQIPHRSFVWSFTFSVHCLQLNAKFRFIRSDTQSMCTGELWLWGFACVHFVQSETECNFFFALQIKKNRLPICLCGWQLKPKRKQTHGIRFQVNERTLSRDLHRN